MPNTFLKADNIVATALELLSRSIVLPRLVTQYGLADFKGAKDDTITIRVPALLTAREYEWRTRAQPIVMDELEELGVPLALDKHPYSAVAITDEELTLDITDFAKQVLQPQIDAVAARLEEYIATAMAGADTDHADIAYAEDPDAAGFYNALVDARAALNAARIPMAGRVVVVGSAVEAAALKENAFRDVSQSGSPGALRDATLGQVAGFTVVSSSSVDDDFAMAFHKSAFAFGNVAPAVPAGAAFGSSQSKDGLALRWIRDYDTMYARDRSFVSSFAGAASVDDANVTDGSGETTLTGKNRRAVKIAFTGAS